MLFSSSRAKLARADEHRQAIEPEIKAFVDGDPVTLGSNHNLKGTDDPIRFAYYVAEITQPPAHWALVAGDAIQNLRAALDHAIWELVVKQKGSQFAEAKAFKIDFPIVDKPSSFPRSRLVEVGLPEPSIAVIENAQPYVREQDAPRRDPLWFLRELSNVDKHRLLHVVSMIGEDAVIHTTPFLPNGRPEFVAAGALFKGAEIVRFTAPRPVIKANVQVQLEYRMGISIEATPKTGAVGIDLVLRVMRDRVTETLAALAMAANPKRRRKR
jgi:hypothetical protein